MATKSSIMDTNSYSDDFVSLLSATTKDMISRREKWMGGAYRLFYRKPVNLVRGKGQYLWDAEGNKDLDMYNNVAGIGHCHPAVVEAVTEQMKLLNTHTRYLHERIIDYSEDLLAMMPEEIDKIMFMCTGSEANDLALRVAQEYTGGTGIIVSREAYHGTSALTSGCSPALGSEQPLLPNVRLIDTPDYYRHGGTPEEFTAWYSGEMQKKINELAAAGYKFSCFLADSIFSSDGVHPNPVGFLKAAIDVVHKNGGVFIADEVQPGFARTGDAFWGFARHGIIPDMVTTGKPMGNGIPISGLAAKHEVLEAAKQHPAWETGKDNEYVEMTYQTLVGLGQDVKKIYWQFGTDGSVICGKYNIPTIGYSGAMMSQAHQAQEHVEISRVLDCIEGYTAVLCKLYDLAMPE